MPRDQTRPCQYNVGMTQIEHTAPRIDGPWSQAEIGSFLSATAVPIHLAVNTRSGFPAVTPLWFLWQQGALWAASKPDAAIVKLLRKDGRCAFDISV